MQILSDSDIPIFLAGCEISGYRNFKGVCYKDFSDERVSYAGARRRCAEDGALVAMPKDIQINYFISTFYPNTERIWLGLTDAGREGRWVFEDGTRLSSTGYSNWDYGEPNNQEHEFGPEDCAEMKEYSYEWNDVGCYQPLGFICQLDTVATTSAPTTSAPGCGGLLTAPPGGTVTSPNYPSNYGNRATCEWTITVAEGSVVLLTFDSFRLESGYDYLKIYDGGSGSAPRLRRLTGYGTPDPITSTSNQMVVRFRSDYSNTAQGFQFSYTATGPTIEVPTTPRHVTFLTNTDVRSLHIPPSARPTQQPTYPETLPQTTVSQYVMRTQTTVPQPTQQPAHPETTVSQHAVRSQTTSMHMHPSAQPTPLPTYPETTVSQSTAYQTTRPAERESTGSIVTWYKDLPVDNIAVVCLGCAVGIIALVMLGYCGHRHKRQNRQVAQAPQDGDEEEPVQPQSKCDKTSEIF
ncbi:cubilin-like [Branchiostoma floridae]|uniref:Cubilin-like n=2 Tax=Branchiostoma floridae TaxID=7739 RepID=A0A9J7LZ52_BRAFL|nr:cubilin-like [Branchiostoma floridae]